MKFTYQIAVAGMGGKAVITGSAELMGVNRIRVELPEGTLLSVIGTLPLSVGEDEKIFMNGWTTSPETARSSAAI